MKTAAKLGIVAAVAIAAGCSYPICAYVSGAAFDKHLAELASSVPDGFRLNAQTAASSLFSRSFRVEVAMLDDRGGELGSAVWNGTADLGYGVDVHASLDMSSGFGALLESAGIRGYRDEVLVKIGLTGQVSQALWRVPNGFTVSEANASCRIEPVTLLSKPQKGGYAGTLTVKGLACESLGSAGAFGAGQAFSVKDLSVDVAGRADGSEETTVRTGALAADGLAAESTVAHATVALSKEKAKPRSNGEPQRAWDHVYSFEAVKPQAAGRTGDRFIFKSRLTGLTDEIVESGTAFLQMAALGGAPMQNASLLVGLGLLQDAFVKGGLAWDLDACDWTMGGKTARLAGRLAYQAPQKSGDPMQIGAFSLSIPQEMTKPDDLAVPVARGQMKLIDGNFVSEIRITSEGATANGVPVL